MLVAGIIGKLFLGAPFPFRIEWSAADLGWSVLATLPLAGFAVFLTSRAGRSLPFLGKIYERVKQVAGEAIRGLAPDEVILLSGAAGIGEEVLFRGVLQALIGLWPASLLFGLLHAISPAYLVLATAMGLYLGWLQTATENLLVPIAVHWAYDAFAFFLLRRRLEADARREQGPPGGEDKSEAEDEGDDEGNREREERE